MDEYTDFILFGPHSLDPQVLVASIATAGLVQCTVRAVCLQVHREPLEVRDGK